MTYIYIYICMYIHTYTYIYVYIYIYVNNLSIYLSISIYLSLYMYIYGLVIFCMFHNYYSTVIDPVMLQVSHGEFQPSLPFTSLEHLQGSLGVCRCQLLIVCYLTMVCWCQLSIVCYLTMASVLIHVSFSPSHLQMDSYRQKDRSYHPMPSTATRSRSAWGIPRILLEGTVYTSLDSKNRQTTKRSTNKTFEEQCI